jgi:hypothetical protein
MKSGRRRVTFPVGMARSSNKSPTNSVSVSGSESGPQAGDIIDELPDELNAVDYVGPYQFPDNKRRRVPALLYAALGAVMVGLWLSRRSDMTSLVNRGFGLGGALLIALGLYGYLAGKPMVVTDTEALAAASAHVGFPVGHASAQLGWRGLLSRPTWRILLYSAENPPAKRGLVLVDGVDRTVVANMVEANPEDWSQFDDV